MTEFTAELIGTLVLILLGNGVVANVVLHGTKGKDGGWIVITMGWAMAVFTAVVIAGPYSGAHINPAVTIGLAIAGEFPWKEVPLFITAQLLGAMAGGFLVWGIYKNHFDVTKDSLLQLAAFSTGPAIRHKFSNLLSEIVGTFVLIFAIFYVTDPVVGMTQEETPIGLGSLGAIPVSLIVFAIGLSLGGTTGYAINPARDLGPRIVHFFVPMKNKCKSDWNYAWIPIVGPVMGAAFAAFLFLFLS